MDYQPSPRGSASDLNSPGLVFRGRGGTTPRTSSNPSGFEVQVDLETQQPAAGMGGSNGVGAGRVSSGSGASAGLPYMQQQQQQQYQQPMQQQGMAPPEVCVCKGRVREGGLGVCVSVCMLSDWSEAGWLAVGLSLYMECDVLSLMYVCVLRGGGGWWVVSSLTAHRPCLVVLAVTNSPSLHPAMLHLFLLPTNQEVE